MRMKEFCSLEVTLRKTLKNLHILQKSPYLHPDLKSLKNKNSHPYWLLCKYNMIKKYPKTKSNTSHSIATPYQKAFPFPEIGILFIGLSLLFSFFPPVTRGWGLNYTGFFDLWLTILFYLLLLIFWLPPSNRYIVEKLNSINRTSFIAFCGKHKYILFLILSIAAGVCFYLLKIKYILLGDTDIRAKQIEDGIIMRDDYMTMLSIRYIYLLLNEKIGYTCLQTIQLLDYISGGLFIFISLCISDIIGNTFLKKVAVFFMATLSLATLLIFCGYTDIYMLPLIFLIVYLYTALLYLQKKISVWIPILTLFISITFHLMLVCLAPSLIYLIYSKALWKYPFFRNKRTMIVLTVIAAPFIFYAVKMFAIPMMLPFSSDKGLMTMFSFAHYVEFFNSQLLGGGIGFLIWIAILIYSIIHKIKYDHTLWFLQIASISIAGLIFVFRADRGSGDWDISSFAAVVYNLSNACFLIKIYERKLYQNMKYGILMIAGFSILHSSAWIYTNKTDASLQWVESAFATDPAGYYKSSFNNESMLSAVFSANDLPELALKWGKNAYLKYPNDPRMGFNYARDLINQNRYTEACTVLEQTVLKFPAYPLPYIRLIEIYANTNNYESLYRILLKFEQVYRQAPEAFTSRLSQEQINQYLNILTDLKNAMGQ